VRFGNFRGLVRRTTNSRNTRKRIPKNVNHPPAAGCAKKLDTSTKITQYNMHYTVYAYQIEEN
jgi:hypothetical protein